MPLRLCWLAWTWCAGATGWPSPCPANLVPAGVEGGGSAAPATKSTPRRHSAAPARNLHEKAPTCRACHKIQKKHSKAHVTKLRPLIRCRPQPGAPNKWSSFRKIFCASPRLAPCASGSSGILLPLQPKLGGLLMPPWPPCAGPQ